MADLVKRKRGRPRKNPEPPNTPPAQDNSRIALLRRWQFKVQRSKLIRDKWEKDFSVDQCERYFLGKQRPEGDNDSLVLNYFLATIKVQQPNLFFQNPKFFLQSKGGRSQPIQEADARIGEGILEAIGDHDGNLANAIRLALAQAYFRIGIVKIIYDPQMEPNPRNGQPIWITDDAGNPVFDNSKLRPLTDEQGAPVYDPETHQPIPDPESIVPQQMTDADGNPLFEPDEIPTDETYRYDWVNAKNMLLPDEGPDRTRWTWIGEEIVVPLEDAKKDQRFKAEYRNRLRANETIDQSKLTRYEGGVDSPEGETQRFRYCECYDIKQKKIMVFADGQEFNDFLMYDDTPSGIEDHPYALLLGFTPIIAPEPLPWPLPHTYAWMDAQREYNIRRTQISEGAKRSARKFVFEEGTFDDYDEAVKLLQSPKDMEGAKVNDLSKSPQILAAPDLNPSIYKDIPLLQLDWRIITGQTGARLAAPDSDTATEATFVERASNVRDVDMQQQVTSWLAEAGRKMLQRVKATLTLDMWIRLRTFSDEELQNYVKAVYGISPMEMQIYPGLKEQFKERFGKDQWKAVTRDDIDFEADVSVAPGSSRPKTLDSDRRAFVGLLQIFAQAPQLLLSRELTSRVLRMFEMYDERLLDELTIVAKQMVQINANQAGRNQGGNGAGADGGALGQLAQLAGMASGAAVRPS